MGTFCFCTDQFDNWIQFDYLSLGLKLSFDFSNSVVNIVSLSSFAGLLLLVLINNRRFQIKVNITIQKYISILFWFLFIGLISLFLIANFRPEKLLVIGIPLELFLEFIFY